MDINEIMAYLPHRYPFLLIDRVCSVEAGSKVHAYKNVTMNEPFFAGHFPGSPVMPGVLLIEAMAQAAGILGFVTVDKKPSDGVIYYLAGADKTRFKRPVVPGDRVDLYADLITIRRGVAKFDCRAEVDGELACRSLVTCVEKGV